MAIIIKVAHRSAVTTSDVCGDCANFMEVADGQFITDEGATFTIPMTAVQATEKKCLPCFMAYKQSKTYSPT